MQKTAEFIPPLLLLVGLSGCKGLAVDSGASPGNATRQTREPTIGALVAAARAGSAASSPTASRVTLPLRRGYYVASDTPCSKASNATVMLLQRDGMASARDFCEFRKIEHMAPDTYRVTQACSAFQDSAHAEVSVVSYVLSGNAGFTSKSDGGWEYSARHCPQSSMPLEWRRNDIRQITN